MRRFAIATGIAALALGLLAVPADAGRGPKPKVPDLLVRAVSAPKAVTAGDRAVVVDTTKNRGRGYAVPSETSFELSKRRKPVRSILLKGARPVGGLAAGEQSEGETTVRIPKRTKTGRYFLIACADSGGAVEDLNPGNDCTSSEKRLRVVEPGGDPFDLVLSPADYDFGTLGQNTSATKTFTVTNEGTVTAVAILEVEASGSGFSADGSNCVGKRLPPGGSCDVLVTATAEGVGQVDGQLRVDDGVTTASLSYNGAAPPPFARIDSAWPENDYGTVAVGKSSSPFPFTFLSNGTEATGPASVAITGGNPKSFAISSENCSGRVLQPGDLCTVYVRFSPRSTGAKSATLAVSATPGGTATSSLSGTGS